LADARARFDLVLIDAPPLSYSNDALLLGASSDGLVLVTRPGYTDKAVLEALLEQLLENEDLPLLGAIVNAAGAANPVSPADPGVGATTLAHEAQPMVRSIDF
jgi:Mrp family chromosome partitioning ATPase